MPSRLKVLSLLLVLGFLILTVRLFRWQVIEQQILTKKARAQYQSSQLLVAPRGNILASDDSWLAANAIAYQVFAEPRKLTQKPREIAEKLVPLFLPVGFERKEILAEVDRITGLFSRQDALWLPLKAKISPEAKDRIEGLNLVGIGFTEIADRIYPEGSSSAQLLGFVGKDKNGNDTGYFGLEGFYDFVLSGKPGLREGEKDILGRPILVGQGKEILPVGGVNLKTSIDRTIQLTTEKKLGEGIEKYGAAAGSVIVAKPTDGKILAMCSFPSYDPVSYAKFGDALFKNPTISDLFEPGSVFKIVIMAAALDAGVVEAETKCDICFGPLHLDKYIIETWDKKYHPDSTMTEVIVHSDNVGMSFVAQKLGVDKLYDYLDRFGIGKETGIDLQGEVAGNLRKRGTWNVVDLATASFGQGIAVSPIQLITAATAIANGGYKVTPNVVSALTGEGWQEPVKVKPKERIISEKTAQTVTAMMVEAAKNGEAKWTNLKGFSVAGKTGTAQIPIAGHYDTEKTMASFIGFAPAANPKFIMLVTLKEPQSSPWASETAAPLWYAIAKDLFPYFGIQPEN